MELIEDLDKKQKYYDAYFIFDADNILDKNYIKEMTSTYNKGYEIGIGYRNIKNKNNPLAISSGLIFIIINSLINKRRNKTTLNKIISGSGFYIKDSLIKKWKTYPFHTLTEDYELTLYSIINNTSTYYNKNAKFYDEQPTEYKVYKIERTRWIKGYFETRKKYRKELLKKLSLKNKNYSSVYNELIGVWDIIILLIGLLLIIINMLLNLNTKVITNIIKIILIIYISLVIFTLIILKTENKNLKLTNKMKIQVSLIHPLLLFSYIPCAIKAIFTKNLTWIKIEHKEHLKE